MNEKDILQTAIENLGKLTHGKIQIEKDKLVNDLNWDALINLKMGNVRGRYMVEVVNNVSPTILIRLQEKLTRENGLIVAKKISQSNQDLLLDWGINYLEVSGNCLIQNQEGLYIRIKGESIPAEFKDIKHKAFNSNGIKLVYTLMLQPNLINETYRQIADTASISLSTIGYLLEDLKEFNFLEQVNDDKRQLTRKLDLFPMWVTAYQQRLKPKQFRGKYRVSKKFGTWKELKLDDMSWWGGEPAADILTHTLSPEVWTLYSNHDRRTMMDYFGLIPDQKHGNVEVYSPFWKEEEDLFVNNDLSVVNPLLVYADLMASGENRNIETAKRIYERYITDILK